MKEVRKRSVQVQVTTTVIWNHLATCHRGWPGKASTNFNPTRTLLQDTTTQRGPMNLPNQDHPPTVQVNKQKVLKYKAMFLRGVSMIQTKVSLIFQIKWRWEESTNGKRQIPRVREHTKLIKLAILPRLILPQLECTNQWIKCPIRRNQALKYMMVT